MLEPICTSACAATTPLNADLFANNLFDKRALVLGGTGSPSARVDLRIQPRTVASDRRQDVLICRCGMARTGAS